MTTQDPPSARKASHRPLLLVLQREGPLTADQLADRIGLSRGAVLHQLGDLGAAGLVDRRSLRHGVGRPLHLYDVTPDAKAFLPDGYDALSQGLLDAAESVGGRELVARLFDARRRALIVSIRREFVAAGIEDAPLIDRVGVLAGLQDRGGYAAIVTQERGLRLRQRNCPIAAVALACPEACDAELRLFSDVLAAHVERESSIATGSRECTYRIRAREWGAVAPSWSGLQMRSASLGPAGGSADVPAPGWDAAQMRGRPAGATRRSRG